MMFTDLNASDYRYTGNFYNAEFEHLLLKIINCYDLMLANSVSLSNDENAIRDILYLNYLNDNAMRRKVGLKDYFFDREVPEDRSRGRTDIRIISPDSFEDTSAYYIIECKRLDRENPNGTTGLNAKYIEDGICRFASSLYTAHYNTNGMIGFIVDSMDIENNIRAINTLLSSSFPQANTIQELKKRDIILGFNFSYFSQHKIEDRVITIYHLMFNFSGKMRAN